MELLAIIPIYYLSYKIAENEEYKILSSNFFYTQNNRYSAAPSKIMSSHLKSISPKESL